MPDKGRLVVSGASGFVGTRLVELALAAGWQVTALARKYDHDRWTQFACSRLSIVQWSIEDLGKRCDFLAGADAICHLAAFVPPDFSDPAGAQQCFRINAMGTLDLVQRAMDAKVGRFILFSSGQIYAYNARPVREDDSVYPARRAPYYLSSKLAAELFVQHHHLNHSLPATILRLSSVYGPGMKSRGLIPQFLRNALEGTQIEVHEGGRYTVDLVYVDDVVRATLAAAERGVDGILNVGSGTTSTSLQAAEAIVDASGARRDLIKVLPSTGCRLAEGFSTLDITRARKMLAYEPLGLKEGIEKWLSSFAASGSSVDNGYVTATVGSSGLRLRNQDKLCPAQSSGMVFLT